MSVSPNPLLSRLDIFIGRWELTAVAGEQVMSVAQTELRWLGERGFLLQRTDPPSFLVPQWQGAAPIWVEAVIGADDHSQAYTMLYTDSRHVCRVYAMQLNGREWTMSSRPGQDFHQRWIGAFSEDLSAIEGDWEASTDGQTWSKDFHMSFRRLS
ncbi:hypothetical protein Rhe02_84750 [Rhizocola hellebori]|uniref:DUF1579 domain-containing protein n=1 Tax=Rhizocola hellebori TaxID=1392758 RepID=A0A8J3VLQ8_9ACTN|nr:hypothetical protein [Rhizocola hellebori]GIH10408.1 hypothetical protein Rhe02_84750 [Rhizocola hellebori]